MPSLLSPRHLKIFHMHSIPRYRRKNNILKSTFIKGTNLKDYANNLRASVFPCKLLSPGNGSSDGTDFLTCYTARMPLAFPGRARVLSMWQGRKDQNSALYKPIGTAPGEGAGMGLWWSGFALRSNRSTEPRYLPPLSQGAAPLSRCQEAEEQAHTQQQASPSLQAPGGWCIWRSSGQDRENQAQDVTGPPHQPVLDWPSSELPVIWDTIFLLSFRSQWTIFSL